MARNLRYFRVINDCSTKVFPGRMGNWPAFFIILLHFQLTGSTEIIRCCIHACPSRAEHGESAVMASGKIKSKPSDKH